MARMFFLGLKRIRDPYYQGFAAQISFYFLMSIVPIIILLTQILGLFGISPELISEMIGRYASGTIADFAREWLEGSGHSATNIVMIILALWAGSRVQFAMMRISNFTMSAGEYTGDYWTERLRSIKVIFLTLITITFALIVVVYGDTILNAILKVMSTFLNIKYHVSNVWYWLRWPIGLLMYFLMVSYNYFVLTSEKIRYRKLIPGSIFASIGMLIATLLYSQYAKFVISGNFNIIYGSLASIVALMLWFYLIAWILVLGILCNRVWQDTARPQID